MIFDQGYHDECGVVGIAGHPEASNIAYLGLYALQHRGQESAGIVSTDGVNLFAHRSMGHVADIFSRATMDELKGTSAIGHVRYSTQGGSFIKNAQPVAISCWRGAMALAHNGNLVNALELRQELERDGSIFQTTNDSEVILHLVARAPDVILEDALASALRQIKGAYSILVMTKDRLIGVRDPHGFRPLVLGDLKGAPVLVSETCALDLVGARFVREIEPGEMLVMSPYGMTSMYPQPPQKPAACIFELIYFARPDSIVFGQPVYMVRKKLGRQLAVEQPVEADTIIPVPDSGIGAALGFSEESGIPFEMGLIRNHYIGRTFIEPRQSIRDFGVKIKLNPVPELMKGKRVVLVDDSIVRGTTSRKLVRMVRAAGAREVHFRISSPPTIGPCRYGIDTPTSDELIATHKTLPQICDYIEADSLGYLSIPGMLSAAGLTENDRYCLGCFNLDYPITLRPRMELLPGLFDSGHHV